MKKNNKKGFTIVELVIVIAVIGILAAVLIPTFSSVIADANEKAALQTAVNSYKQAQVDILSVDGSIDENDSATVAGITWTANEDGELEPTGTVKGYNVSINNGVVTVSKP